MCLLEIDWIAKNNFAQKVQTQFLSLIIIATIQYFCSLLFSVRKIFSLGKIYLSSISLRILRSWPRSRDKNVYRLLIIVMCLNIGCQSFRLNQMH